MKKKYSLDYSIERDVDRLHAIEDILDQLDTNPTPTELEQMASYILYGKDEDGKNAVQRGETTDADRRYASYKRASEKTQSLDTLLDNPLTDQQGLRDFNERYIYTKKKPTIKKPKFDKQGNLIDIGDADVPGMLELWERINYIEKVVAANEGKIPFDDSLTILPDSYRLYQLRHQLIDMRRHQYYLKDSVKPTIHFLSIKPPQPQSVDFDSDSYYWMSLEDWEVKMACSLSPYVSRNLRAYATRETANGLEVKWIVRHQCFDWENPKHIAALINNYSAIYMQNWDKLHSWGRTLIFDFDRYVDMADLTPIRQYILLRKIDQAPYPTIVEEIQQKFGIRYNESHLSVIVSKEIPEKIAFCAKRHRLEVETPLSERKRCSRCKRWLPKDPIFFGANNTHLDHFASACKECEKLRRIEKGGSKYDRRSKDPTLHQV